MIIENHEDETEGKAGLKDRALDFLTQVTYSLLKLALRVGRLGVKVTILVGVCILKVLIPGMAVAAVCALLSRGWIHLEGLAVDEVSASYYHGLHVIAETEGFLPPEGVQILRSQIQAQTRSPRGEREVRDLILDEMDKNNLEIGHYRILRAMIKVESTDDPYIVSHAGARGLFQIMPWVSEKRCKMPHNAMFDKRENIKCGVWWYAEMLKSQKGDVYMALTEYNAGAERMFMTEESRQYARKVINTAVRLEELE